MIEVKNIDEPLPDYADILKQHPDHPVVVLFKNYHPTRATITEWVVWANNHGHNWYPRPVEYVNSDTLVLFTEAERDLAFHFKVRFV